MTLANVIISSIFLSEFTTAMYSSNSDIYNDDFSDVLFEFSSFKIFC